MGAPVINALMNTVIAPFLCALIGPYTLAKRSATVCMPYAKPNALQYASPQSLLAPYGEMGLGSDCSLTGGVALPIKAPPVDAKMNLRTPASRAQSRTLKVPCTLLSKFATGA